MLKSAQEKKDIASKALVHASTCALVEQAIMHVGIVNAMTDTSRRKAIVFNTVVDYNRKHGGSYVGS